MVYPWNPSPDEIRIWAHTPGAVEPCQDWDLALCCSLHEKALLQTASDESCPKRRYMLAVLYLVVGDAVRSGFRSRPRPIIEGFLSHAKEYDHPDIRAWRRRSQELLANPMDFDYDLWCGGGLARGVPA
jgi:hypothetical protein